MEVKLVEKRRFPRISIKTPLRFQIRGTPESSNSVTEDISTGGISFRSDSFIAPATNLMLQINVLSRVISPIGKVAWSLPIPRSNRYRMGVEFLELEMEEKKYLSNYIDMQRNNI